MGSIDRRLSKLEQEAEGHFFESFTLQDGSTIRCEVGEIFDVLSAVLRDREHRLLPAIRRIDTNEGMPGLIRALESSKARRDGA